LAGVRQPPAGNRDLWKKVALVLNRKTAKALGDVTIPLSLLGRADELIE
jgi:hypothetical protein